MKIAFFDTHSFERPYFDKANVEHDFMFNYIEPRLTEQTAQLAEGSDCVCAFVNDNLSAMTIEILARVGVKLIALRSAGFNHVDLATSEKFGLPVVRVPEYSPFAVAEHAVALILILNRKIHRANSRVQEGNFSLNGLVGFDLNGKTIGVIGTGKIGSIFVKIMRGFGCEVLTYDAFPDKDISRKYGSRYVKDIDELLRLSDIISLHVPLGPSTHHLINSQAIAKMKKGVMLINTGRGSLVDTKALIEALKIGQIGYAGLDVYEEEEKVFFQDLSDEVIQDDVLARLLTFPNVILTSHQAFLTAEALQNIADTTLFNIAQFHRREKLTNEVCLKAHVKKK